MLLIFNGQQTLNYNITDTSVLNVGLSYVYDGNYFYEPTENFTFTDSVNAQVISQTIAVSLSDNISPVVPIFILTSYGSVLATNSNQALIGAIRAVTDNLTTSNIFYRNLVDSYYLEDNLTQGSAGVSYREIISTSIFSDNVTDVNGIFYRSLSETFSFTDALTRTSAAFRRNFTETFSVSDLLQNNYLFFVCPVLPSLQNIQLMNLGQESYADNLIGYDFMLYRGLNTENDVSGYITPSSVPNEFSWYPTLGTYYSLAIRQDNTQDIHWPVLNVFNDKFAIAWLETHETGVLRLNYGELTATPTPSPFTNTPGAGQVYIYPYIGNVLSNVTTENIPLNDLQVIDANNKVFHLNPYAGIAGYGYNTETPAPVKSVRFLQSFRQNSQLLAIKLTTAPTMTQIAGLMPSQPIPNYPINIYYGNTNMIFKKLKTGLDGTVSCSIPNGLFLFEIQTINDNVLWSQTLL